MPVLTELQDFITWHVGF